MNSKSQYASPAHELRAHDLTRRAQRKGEEHILSLSAKFEERAARATDDRHHQDISPQDSALNELRDTLDAGLSPLERLERQAADTLADYHRTMDGRANFGFVENKEK
jgi:hypothetical protein